MKEFAPGLFRGPVPCGADLDKVKSVINLETSTRELIFGGANRELILCLRNGVQLFDFAFSGITTPDRNAVAMVSWLLREGAPKPVYLHCRAGRERTGFMVAVYRMRVQGWSFERAYKEWLDEGCRWPTSWLWKEALRRWLPK